MAAGIGLAESASLASQNGPTIGPVPVPLVVPDDGLYELVDGQLVEKEVGAQQVEIANILGQVMGAFARTHRLGRVVVEMVFRIDRDRNLQRQPDVAFISDARWPFRRRVPDVPVWDLVPDLAIEVVSPNNMADEVEDKKQEYFKAGVNRVWVVYPRQGLVHVWTSPTQVQVLTADRDLEGGELLPGFHFHLAGLFEDDPEVE